ncbi:A/G-specific adenine glycosylase [Sphingomonas sabuli]|uniref:Adenine DNA glycosylase n=1 Tax=Sphingomonas sabuli TaxID=2764186 RepID=A0A7G9L5E5_9SPHN|nr:A/G-specific adenine glycosylase [Sphingomonas sabuli]QNM83844.1 A/G-specific adenine glycosylase [Sphingomonas sabuli]
MRANLSDRLLQHYVDKCRALPWRSPPGSPPPDSYRVWLSEVMLQQTTVAAVTPRFERFLARWPTVEALAAALDEDVLAEWAGLGYYARARNLIACAREVAARGGFPTTEAGLRALPGIGDYTAAAIAAIAFGAHAVVIDANVERVTCRLFALAAPTRGDLRAAVASITPAERAGDFAQAMMDLGATICRPRAPLCDSCPLRDDCRAFASGNPERFPAPKAKAAKPVRHGVAQWIERDGAIWLVRRPTKGLLGGMAALPGPVWTAERQANAPELARVRHVFTHFALELAVVAAADPVGEGWWQPFDTLADAGLPTLYRRAVDAVLTERGRIAA